MTVALSRVEVERGLAPQQLLQARPDQARFVFIPYRRYLMVDGDTTPGGKAFKQAISALYPVAYTLHFALRARGVEAPVGTLEGLYWWPDAAGPIAPEAFADGHPVGPMNWRLLIPVPDAASDDEISAAIVTVRAKADSEGLRLLRWEGWLEGDSAQILHVGQYDAEYPTILRLTEAIREAGFQPRVSHHEIYLSRPNAAPERMKTIIRQPIEEAGW